MDIHYNDYLKADTYDIRYDNNNSDEYVALIPLNKSKFAGWCDLYSKEFYENLCPPQEDWIGYGPWDHYSMIISDYAKSLGVDYQQYLLKGETIWMYPSGPLLENGANGFTQYYRDRLKLNDIPSQRQSFEVKLPIYLNKGIELLKTKNIL
jgi:hypothetical protein